MIASDVDICNLALGWLGGNKIMTIDGSEDSTEAILCKDNYASARDVALEARNWTFAAKRFAPTPISEAPAFEYSHQFLLPADCLKVREVSSSPKMNDQLEWEKEGRYILCNKAVIYLKYTARITDVIQFSPNFVQGVAARLAADIAVPLTDSKTLMKDMEVKYLAVINDAGAMDGLQGVNRVIRSNQLIRVR